MIYYGGGSSRMPFTLKISWINRKKEKWVSFDKVKNCESLIGGEKKRQSTSEKRCPLAELFSLIQWCVKTGAQSELKPFKLVQVTAREEIFCKNENLYNTN